MRDQQAVAAMLCPVCKVGLAMSDRAGIEIDYCPQCRGVWLDRGELDKIIERSASEAAPAPAPAPQPSYPTQPAYAPRPASPWGHGDHRGYHGKRKKSFLEDLFD